MSTRVAVQNVRSLTDIGNIPYSLARPFLLKVESPKQLREIEKNSPHIMNDDKELWLEFIKRDIPQWDQYDIPHESDSWYDIYCDLLEQVQREVEEGALQLKQAVDKFYSEKASHAAVLVKDTSRLPKPRRRFHHSAGGRSEPKKAGIFSSKRNKVLAVPTHQLHSGASRINHVPQWLVDEHKHAPSSSAASSASKHTSKPVNTTSGAPSSSSSSSTRVSAPRGRPPPRPTTPTKKENSSELPPGSRPIVPRKRSLENNGPVPRMSTAATTTSVRTSSPVRLSPTTPGKAIIRKRPIASQPNIFIQQKKRKV